jgi:hypothetical protein
MVSPKWIQKLLNLKKLALFFRNFGEKPKGKGAFFWKFWDTLPSHFNFCEGRCWRGDGIIFVRGNQVSLWVDT